MDVSSTIFQPIFEGVKQYVVPLFQRSYSWGEERVDDFMDGYKGTI